VPINVKPTPPPQYGRRQTLGRDLNFKTGPRVGNLIKRFKTITDHMARDKTTVPRGSVNVDSGGFCFYKISTATVGMSEKTVLVCCGVNR